MVKLHCEKTPLNINTCQFALLAKEEGCLETEEAQDMEMKFLALKRAAVTSGYSSDLTFPWFLIIKCNHFLYLVLFIYVHRKYLQVEFIFCC